MGRHMVYFLEFVSKLEYYVDMQLLLEHADAGPNGALCLARVFRIAFLLAGLQLLFVLCFSRLQFCL